MKPVNILLLITSVLCSRNSSFAQTWTQSSAPETNWIAVTSSADGTKLAAAASYGGIWVSTNSGDTWIQTSAPNAWWVSLASSADGSQLMAGEAHNPTVERNGFLYISTDSGNTWITNSLPSLGWTSVSSSADGTTLAALSGTGFEDALIVSSTNSGITWVSNNVALATSVASSADGTKMVAVGLATFLSTNSGGSWTQTNSLDYGGTSVASWRMETVWWRRSENGFSPPPI